PDPAFFGATTEDIGNAGLEATVRHVRRDDPVVLLAHAVAGPDQFHELAMFGDDRRGGELVGHQTAQDGGELADFAGGGAADEAGTIVGFFKGEAAAAGVAPAPGFVG